MTTSEKENENNVVLEIFYKGQDHYRCIHMFDMELQLGDSAGLDNPKHCTLDGKPCEGLPESKCRFPDKKHILPPESEVKRIRKYVQL